MKTVKAHVESVICIITFLTLVTGVFQHVSQHGCYNCNIIDKQRNKTRELHRGFRRVKTVVIRGNGDDMLQNYRGNNKDGDSFYGVAAATGTVCAAVMGTG